MTNKAKIGASIVLDWEKEFKSAVTACNKKLATMNWVLLRKNMQRMPIV